MLNNILKTDSEDYAMLLLRIVLGILIFAHGAQKLLGIWGGHGVKWTVSAWEHWWGIPSPFTVLVIGIESFGALLLMLGFLTRIWSACIGVIMLVAVYLVHWPWGFYMNWYMEPQRGEGFEYHILVLAIVTVLILKGGGRWSLDSPLFNRFNNTSD